MDEVFPYECDKRFLPVWGAFGVRPSRDAVTVTDDGRFVATYGFARLETTVDNIDGAHVTRGYRWYTAVGIRKSFKDAGLTFGTNVHAGVCVHFREPVHAVFGRSGWTALTVTVAELDGLVAALERRIGGNRTTAS